MESVPCSCQLPHLSTTLFHFSVCSLHFYVSVSAPSSNCSLAKAISTKKKKSRCNKVVSFVLLVVQQAANLLSCHKLYEICTEMILYLHEGNLLQAFDFLQLIIQFLLTVALQSGMSLTSHNLSI